MATTSQRARTTVITLIAGTCGLVALAYPNWRVEAQTQRYPTRITECPTTITQPGSYILVRNLTARGDCLVIEADFVTIDLAGFVITGNDTGTGIGAGPADRQGIAVRNGSLAGFENSVVLGSGAIVEKVRTVGAGINGIAVGPDSIVSGNIVQTAEEGIFGIAAGPGSTVSGNTVDVPIGTTISADSDSIVSGNTTSGGEPSSLRAGPGSIVSGNTVREVGLEGIVLEGGGIVSGNTVEGGESGGIIAGPGATVSGNNVRGGAVGIQVTCPSNVIGNTATGSGTNLDLIGAGCTNIDNLAP